MQIMNWKIVRLELASTEDYPRGSAGRALLLNVPIASDGTIDRAAIDGFPGRATVRRFWGSEPDSFGPIEALDGVWSLQCDKGAGDKSVFLLDSVPLRLNSMVSVRQAEGSPLPFRVASVRSAGQQP